MPATIRDKMPSLRARRACPLSLAMLLSGCSAERAPPSLAPPRQIPGASHPAAVAPPATTSNAAPASSLPACRPNEYTLSDVFDRRPGRACDPPQYCSTAYWSDLKVREAQPGLPPDAKQFAEGQCVVRTERAFLEWVTVTPEGEAPFLVRVENIPVTVLPAASRASSEVAVRGLLSFFGRSRITSYGVTPGVSLASGRLHTGSRTRAVPTAIEGSSAEVDLLLADDVTAHGVSLPCASLRATEEPYPPAQSTSNQRKGKVPRGPSVSLFVSARSVSPLALTIPYLTTHETSGPRIRVSQTMDDGGSVSGWVPTDQLTEPEGGGGRGYGIGGSACGCPRASGRAIRVALRSGTPVAARPGGARWATFSVATELAAVEVDADWLKVQGLRGVYETFSHPGSPCDDLRAFVRRSDARVVGAPSPR